MRRWLEILCLGNVEGRLWLLSPDRFHLEHDAIKSSSSKPGMSCVFLPRTFLCHFVHQTRGNEKINFVSFYVFFSLHVSIKDETSSSCWTGFDENRLRSSSYVHGHMERSSFFDGNIWVKSVKLTIFAHNHGMHLSRFQVYLIRGSWM